MKEIFFKLKKRLLIKGSFMVIGKSQQPSNWICRCYLRVNES